MPETNVSVNQPNRPMSISLKSRRFRLRQRSPRFPVCIFEKFLDTRNRLNDTNTTDIFNLSQNLIWLSCNRVSLGELGCICLFVRNDDIGKLVSISGNDADKCIPSTNYKIAAYIETITYMEDGATTVSAKYICVHQERLISYSVRIGPRD